MTDTKSILLFWHTTEEEFLIFDFPEVHSSIYEILLNVEEFEESVISLKVQEWESQDKCYRYNSDEFPRLFDSRIILFYIPDS